MSSTWLPYTFWEDKRLLLWIKLVICTRAHWTVCNMTAGWFNTYFSQNNFHNKQSRRIQMSLMKATDCCHMWHCPLGHCPLEHCPLTLSFSHCAVTLRKVYYTKLQSKRQLMPALRDWENTRAICYPSKRNEHIKYFNYPTDQQPMKLVWKPVIMENVAWIKRVEKQLKMQKTIIWNEFGLTLVRSIPVRAWTDGGMEARRRVTSEVVRSSPTRTISSVFARGAATSAAICNRKQENDHHQSINQ